MSHITPPPVVDYAARLGPAPHPELAVVAAEGREAGVPIVHAATGELLHVLVQSRRASRVLEVGTAIGYSGLWMATALPDEGRLITLERDEARAARARAHFAATGVGDKTTVVIGDAARYLHKVAGPFDIVFQDADKAQYAGMLDRLAELLTPGGLLVTDNVFWSGDVVPGFHAEPVHDAASIASISEYNERLAGDRRFVTTFLAIGDGVAVSVKR